MLLILVLSLLEFLVISATELDFRLIESIVFLAFILTNLQLSLDIFVKFISLKSFMFAFLVSFDTFTLFV
jgi:hypothetical protein